MYDGNLKSAKTNNYVTRHILHISFSMFLLIFFLFKSTVSAVNVSQPVTSKTLKLAVTVTASNHRGIGHPALLLSSEV